MPTSYPFPTVARLALSLYASARKVERLPMIVEHSPYAHVEIVPMPTIGPRFESLARSFPWALEAL